MLLSERANRIKPSPTLAISARAKRLRAQGEDVISFDVGEPDFDTPAAIKQAAIEALQQGFTKYTAAAGIDELRAAICRKLQEENHLTYEPNQIVVSCGAKHALFNIFQALLNPGDEVIIPAPYWVSYPDQVLLADGKPVFIIGTEAQGFKITAEQLAAAITPRTRAVVINSPSNPAGAVYTLQELRALAEVVLQHKDVYVISDEIYERLVYDGAAQVSIASLGDEIKQRTIVVNGFSKTFAMTGWRLGYTASDAKLATAMANIQSQSTSNPTSFVQIGGLAALQLSAEEVNAMVAEFDRRRRRIVELLNNLPGVSCRPPQGAFYAFANVSGTFGKTYKGQLIETSDALAQYLLEEAKVAIVPGEGFGMGTHARLSYATSVENIEEGLARVHQALTG
ncbi:MAG: pyridoxal phosphate-dependent aminotransferase [Abditibacteriales bacterium]|nr:pyridoxal phosphate-dependent aminotransferase [Abditibacteriales bacterium]MDW8364314.1 pyridoxal phosphate-dependent aminotransferase [Abditibacteriales bacterium]